MLNSALMLRPQKPELSLWRGREKVVGTPEVGKGKAVAPPCSALSTSRGSVEFLLALVCFPVLFISAWWTRIYLHHKRWARVEEILQFPQSTEESAWMPATHPSPDTSILRPVPRAEWKLKMGTGSSSLFPELFSGEQSI